MAYLARTLIADAYNLSGIVGRGYETVSGQQESDGLSMLNGFLAIKSANSRYIPYFKQLDITAVIGQETYFVPGLIQIETFVFYINQIRYQTQEQQRNQYFGWARAEDIESLPLSWHYERTLNGANLYVYFKPNTDYPMQIWGKFNLASVTLEQDLSLTLDKFYLEYLKFGVANYFCANNGITFNPQAYSILQEMEKQIPDISPPDFTLQVTNMVGNGTTFMYADANVGKGYRP